MKYEITGIDSVTGVEREIVLEADSEEEALAAAKARAVLAYRVRAVPPPSPSTNEERKSDGFGYQELLEVARSHKQSIIVCLILVWILVASVVSAFNPKKETHDYYRPVITERYYGDRDGILVSETLVEEKIRNMKRKIQEIPADLWAERAYYEGMLKAVEEEWERTKRKGPTVTR